MLVTSDNSKWSPLDIEQHITGHRKRLNRIFANSVFEQVEKVQN